MSLADFPFEAWGNRFDQKAMIFQLHNNDWAALFYGGLKQAYDDNKDSGYFRKEIICSPDGILCSETYSLNIDPTDSYSGTYLWCDEDTERGQRYGNRCVFVTTEKL